MSRVVDQIRGWAARTLKSWEQAALEKLIDNSTLQEDDYTGLVARFEEDAGLKPFREINLKLSQPSAADFAQMAESSVKLRRIFNLRNVNALEEGQELPFGERMTIIYGSNGAGKTGYARPLGCACFSRGDREVLSDASRPQLDVKPQADIEISVGDAGRVITWTEGMQFAELQSFHVFDDESAQIHVTESDALSFSPAGLSLLTELAAATDKVRARIRTLIAQRRQPHTVHLYFQGDSDIKERVRKLASDADFAELERLAAFSPDDEEDRKRWEYEVAKLKTLDVHKRMAKLRQEAADVDDLITALTRSQSEVGEVKEAEIATLIRDIETRRKEASEFGVSQFASNEFTQIGSPAWIQFVSAAKVLAEAEGLKGVSYPSLGDSCMLCRQPLSTEAITFLHKLWAFLTSNPQAHAQQVEQAGISTIRSLEGIRLDYFAPASSIRRLIENDVPALVSPIDAFLDACKDRRSTLTESLGSTKALPVPPMIALDLTDLRTVADQRRIQIDELRASDVVTRLSEAEAILRSLEHRKILGQHICELRSFLEATKWAKRAEDCLGSTAAITIKYDTIFEELVTQRYKQFFSDILANFSPNLRVEVETRGKKGSTVRQIVLSSKAYPREFPVEKVLSEGEKRAVALADFLAEAELHNNNHGLILDDPVTSLDAAWKDALARVLLNKQANGK